MASEILSPTLDFVFALIFGDQKNIDILSAFLKTILNIPEEEYDHLTIVNPFLKRLWKKDKLGIVDIKVHTTSKRVINVEMQVSTSSKMRNRIVFYGAKLLGEQMKMGYNYAAIHQVISIVIYDDILIPGEPSYINTWEIRNGKTGEQFTDLLKIITIELSKLPKEYAGQPEWPWLQYFKCSTRKELEMLVKSHPEVRKAAAVLEELSWSERHRMLAEAREKERRDIQAMIEDGRNEGRKEMALEAAQRLKARGLPSEHIAEDLSLPLDVVEKL
jgi:predicted transposase/invertase (TIGR01784 family)